ncbi:MAG: nucleotidyltransferase family protein [Bacteroidaceae bacterium]|nr:nucleotidyltransferase family protein [Bacteroidaceae bacterium]
MKNIVIAAGYATRLYPLTENFPKPLLKVGGSTILGRMMHDVDTFPEVDEHIIVTNHKFAHIFEAWAATETFAKPVRIIDDGTSTNETRLGAVRDLLLAIETCQVDDDIMVLAADNLLDFSLRDYVDFFLQKGTSVCMCHHQPSLERLHRSGVVELDDHQRVIGMEEKPAEPKSHWSTPPFYIYHKNDMPLIRDCMNHGCGFDAPGNLLRYLCQLVPIHAYVMKGNRFDIGSLDTYEEAKRIYGE